MLNLNTENYELTIRNRTCQKCSKLRNHDSAYGDTYKPAKNTLEIEALNTLLAQSRDSISKVTGAKNQLDLAINQRQIKFNTLRPTATRIVNALQATDASTQIIGDTKTINNKLQGRRTTAKSKEETQKRTISTSQLSYDSLTENFAKLIDLITAESTYKPNEQELKIETLTTYLQELQKVNTNVVNANTAYSNALISRDKTLYAGNTGLVDTALNVKKYIISLFGATSPQYKQISKLEFKRPK